MARIRYTHNSFSTGFISQKIRGNVNFEGYNDGLVECTNFIIQHTGGCFKRGGTEFINRTKDDEEALLIPFYFSGEESYMCEFGDGYIRFYTKYGPVKDASKEIYEVDVGEYFDLDDVRKASTYQNGNIMTLVMITGIFTLTRVSQDPVEFKVEREKFTYPPLTPINYSSDTEVQITKNVDVYTVIPYSKDGASHIPDVKYAPFFHDSDKYEVFAINVTKDGSEKKYSLRITDVQKFNGGFNKILCKWDSDLNSGQPAPDDLTGEFVEWQISRFSADRVKDLKSIGVGLYEGRLFLGAENLVWGSSLVMQDLLDFKLGTNQDDAVAFVLTETESDNILWMAGHSKLFLATAGGLFMAGAVTFNDTAITTENFRVRLFEKLGAFFLKPIAAPNTIFFADITGINLHEIVLSAETGVYQANDLSLIGNDLTRSGIIAHTWQQSPIKTYWCAVEDGFLCSLTYLKNNGIMAWAKHVIGGKNVKIESVATLHYQKSDTVWMIVKRQVNGEIVRSIEYMHNIYDPLAEEEFRQFFVDSGKIKEKNHTITKIEKSKNYSIETSVDIRAAAGEPDAQELKLLIRMENPHGNPEQGGKPFNPFCEYVPLTARNFQKTDEDLFRFDVYTNFDYIRSLNVDGTIKYDNYTNPAIKYGKINPENYQNEKYPTGDGYEIYVMVTDIRRIDSGEGNTKIHCDTSKISEEDKILFWNTGMKYGPDPEVPFDYGLNLFNRDGEKMNISFTARQVVNDSFNAMNGAAPVPTSGTYSARGEVFKRVVSEADNTLNFDYDGSDAVLTVKGKVELSEEAQRELKGGDVYINKVSGMTEINGLRFKIKSVRYDVQEDISYVTLFDYTKTPWELNPQYSVALDTQDFSVYDLKEKGNGNMYEYFTEVDGLDHLFGQTVSVCSNGNKLSNRVVEKRKDEEGNDWYGFVLDEQSMYCVSGLPITSVLETVPFFGGNLLGSSVGVAGQQIHCVFNLYYSLGGKYGTEERKLYDIPYPRPPQKPFNQPKQLFSGTVKVPVISSSDIYNRRIRIEHAEPLSFNILSMTKEMAVTDS